MTTEPLLRRHAQSPVQPNGFPVQHAVLCDVTRQPRELLGLAESLREGDLLAKLVACLLWQCSEQWRVERARRDRAYTYSLTRQIARRREREADDPALRRRIGRLADLT